MKTILLALALALIGLELRAQMPPPNLMPGAGQLRRPLMRFGNTNNPATPPRYPFAPSFAPATNPPAALAAAPADAPAAKSAVAAPPEEVIPAGTINFQSADVNQVLDIYAQLVGRTLLRPASLPAGQIVLKTLTPLTKSETIEALQAVLALNGIAVVNIGDKFVKVLPVEQANSAGAALDTSTATSLPDLGSYITHIEQLKYIKPSVMAPLIQPFAKLQGGLTPLDDNGILVMRDYAENIKRMLEMIAKIDVSVPAEYVSEVIPIRYAKVDDIASALNALGGAGGGATVSVGASANSGQISGVAGHSSGFGSMGGTTSGGLGGGGYQSGGIGGGINGGSAFGGGQTRSLGGATTTPNGTTTGGSSFQQRLAAIVNRASGSAGGGAGGGGQDQIQLFGQTKIIPNESSSSLLIYATRRDMQMIKDIIEKLDVPLAQVLVEAVIIDYSLGPNTFNFGVSAAQNPKSFTGGGVTNLANVIGAGGMKNGPAFLNFLSSAGTNGSFGNSLGGGLSYFGNIGPTWNVALEAAAADSHASIIQRPRIQTSQAKPAQFFVGDTVPYVTSTYAGYSGGYGGSSYSQLSVGVELDVTPFINPDGLVVMDIQQEIDDLNGYTTIDNVGQIPNTIKRTLNAEIAVRDRDTVMLGGFIKSNKSTSRSGVPFLMDIPLLGSFFSQRNDSKTREELIVLMRPTVLKTPEIAARNTIKEAQRLPGVSATAADESTEEGKLIGAERAKEMRGATNGAPTGGFYNMIFAPDSATNSAAMDNNATDQDKARAALDEKMKELDAQKAADTK